MTYHTTIITHHAKTKHKQKYTTKQTTFNGYFINSSILSLSCLFNTLCSQIILSNQDINAITSFITGEFCN